MMTRLPAGDIPPADAGSQTPADAGSQTPADAGSQTPADADRTTTAPAAGLWPGRHLITILLLAAAALDLTRCGLVLATVRHAGPAAALVTAGLAAAALSLGTARGCQAGRRWSAGAALLIGAASAPQAAAAGFHAAYTIPDTATAALGLLLTVTVLATAGQTRPPAPDTTTCTRHQRATR